MGGLLADLISKRSVWGLVFRVQGAWALKPQSLQALGLRLRFRDQGLGFIGYRV